MQMVVGTRGTEHRVGDVSARYVRRRRLSGLVLGVVSLVNVGCYETGTLMTEPHSSQRVVLVLNDRGRAALSGQLGAGPLSVEGIVESADSAGYMVKVGKVSYIGTGSTTWTGERVRIGRDAVGMVQERKISRARTFLAVAGAGLALGLFIASRGLLGFGDDPPIIPQPPSSS